MREVTRDRAQLSTDRLRVASKVLGELYGTAFESKAWVFLDQKEDTLMKDWFFHYYELVSGIIWMIKNSLEEESEILENYLWEEVVDDGKTEENK